MTKKDVKSIGMALVGAVVLLVVAIVVSVIAASSNNGLAMQLSNLDNQIAAKQASAEMALQERDKQSEKLKASGLNQERTARDNQIAEDFIKSCMTWDSWAAYDAKRSEVKSAYELNDDSRFMCVFMPRRWSMPTEDEMRGMSTEERESTIWQASSVPTSFGYRFPNRFGSNPTIDGFTHYVTFIGANGEYSYITEVRWHNMKDNGATNSYGDIFVYTINEAGLIQNPDAFRVTEG